MLRIAIFLILLLGTCGYALWRGGAPERIADSINDQLTGHAPPTVGRAYGDGVDIATLARIVAKLDFNFIDWEPVLRAMSPLVGHD